MSFRMLTFVASFQYDIRELKKLLSRDWSLWLQCAGRQINCIPKSSATSSTDMSIHSTSVLPWQPMIIEKFSAPIELFLYSVSYRNYSIYQDRRQNILIDTYPYIILLMESCQFHLRYCTTQLLHFHPFHRGQLYARTCCISLLIQIKNRCVFMFEFPCIIS